jgi:GTP-binding protein
VRSGKGGDGAVSFRHERFAPRGGPDGGDGGKGGDVIIKANKNIDTLNFFIHHHHFFAENGENGKSRNKHGKNGKDVIIEVPVGTLVIDRETEKIIADLNEDGKSVIVAKGGKGGKGNKSFATPVERAPHYSEKGEPGVERRLELRLKILSDVGIVGFPNAGKSTLLSKVSNARPTIANYAFTTLSPKIGVVDLGEGKRFVMADLPGLIEGASEGKGMGNEFLAHIERTKVLLFLIDGSERKSIFRTYNALLNELRKYKPELLQKKRVIAINKIDTWKIRRTKEIREKFSKLNETVFFISAKEEIGLNDLLEYLYYLVNSESSATIEEPETEEVITLKTSDKDRFFRIEKIDSHTFRIHQKEIERYVSLTDFERRGSVAELLRYFKRINLDRKLKQAGVKEGDRVIIGDRSFIFKENE